MAFSKDLRWRAVVLHYLYDVGLDQVALVLGVSSRSINRWYQCFQQRGTECWKPEAKKSSRWPQHVRDFVLNYIETNPCFYIEELQAEMRVKFANVPASASTICRALRFDLAMTRKVLTKRAREASALERSSYVARLAPFYKYPDQLVFIDETAKDSRHCSRRFAWSHHNQPAVVSVPFARGERVSVLAAMDANDFLCWEPTRGTFSRKRFHHAFCTKILPFLRPWPLPRSILILDNAQIHMYKELEDAVHSVGALLFFLTTYSPELNPIETGFSLLKRWLQKNANLAFAFAPEEILDVAMKQCTKEVDSARNIYMHCGYSANEIAI